MGFSNSYAQLRLLVIVTEPEPPSIIYSPIQNEKCFWFFETSVKNLPLASLTSVYMKKRHVGESLQYE